MPLPGNILAIDVGSGTQDILLYEEGKAVENCVQMVLPSPTRILARRIARATTAGKDLFLSGNTMGGGPCGKAVESHIQAGLKVYATESAALTFHDNLKEVEKRGIRVTARPPGGVKEIRLTDVDLSGLGKALNLFGVRLPSTVAVAVQDHGFNPGGSNRRFRFQYWEQFLLSGGALSGLIYRTPPPYMTRMIAVQKDAPGAAVMDTCAAAVWGVLCDPEVKEKQGEGLIALNVGNQHTLGALVKGNRILGIFEHHSGRVTREKLISYLERFPRRELSNEEVFDDGGHGCAVHPGHSAADPYSFVAVTGPRREIAQGLGHMAAPYGNMMLSGCFGLVFALKSKLTTESAKL